MTNEKGEFVADESGIISKENIRDRYHYLSLVQNPKLEFSIIKPVISKINHVWITGLAKPIVDKTGKLKAIVIATISLDYFMKRVQELIIGKHGAIGVLDYNKTYFLRVPEIPNTLGTTYKGDFPINQLIHSNYNLVQFSMTSRKDNVSRIFSMKKIENYNLVVAVGLAIKDIFYFWKFRTALYFLGILGLFIFYFRFLLNYLESQDKFEEQRRATLQSSKLTSLGQMAGGIAHEINNPLTIIKAIANQLKRIKSIQEDEKKYYDSIDKINSTVDRIAKIIKGLRNFSRDSFNDPTLPTSLKKIIDETLNLCAEAFKHNSIEITVLPFDDVNVSVREVQIEQVLINLLNNSYDAVIDFPEKWIRIKVETSENLVKILVIDSGPRIKDLVAERMLEPFFTTKEVGKGTGMGLSISKGIVKGHHGRLYYDKHFPHTCFVVELPRSEANLESPIVP